MNELRCLICGKVLVPLDEEFPVKNYWEQNFDDADSWEVSCNYGSRHDTDKLVFGLCDDCIDKKIEEGRLVRTGNILDDIEATLW